MNRDPWSPIDEEPRGVRALLYAAALVIVIWSAIFLIIFSPGR
ncbi:hypothetical protein [Acetobacter nitrogenifigens]|nr:hypothetical protein [Acetobacter nitrogenifigens]